MKGKPPKRPESDEAVTPSPRIKIQVMKRKTLNNPSFTRTWSDEDVLKLLAHVEWCATNGKKFWQDVAPLFCKDVGRPYTQSAIRCKLMAECQKYLKQKLEVGVLFNSGVSYLTDLPRELRDQVKQMASRIHQRESSSGNDFNRQATTTDVDHQYYQHRSILRDGPPPLQMLFSSSNRTRGDRNDDTVSEQDTEPPGQSRELSDVPNGSNALSGNLNGSLQPLNKPRHGSSTVPSGGNSYDQQPEIANMLKRKTEFQLTQKEKSSLETRIFVLEMEKAQLTRENKRLRKCRPDANARNNLAQHLKSTQELLPRNKSSYTEVEALNQRSIYRKYDLLFSNVRDACLDFTDTDNNLPDPATKFEQLAQTWARRTFCRDLRDCLYSASKEELSKDHLLMGLIVAAIFDRVFEPVFPDILNTESPASYKYREYVALKDGPDELHRADLYALHSLVDDKESVILAQKEKILEELILKSLEPLCTSKGHGAGQKALQQKPNGDHGRLASSRPNVEANKRPSLKLGGVLSAALKMKLDMTLSMTRLRFSSFRPGDRFNETNMVRLDGSVAGSAHVKACLFPALYLAPPRERDLESDEYVQEYDPRYNTFFVEATREEVASLELVAHAVVLT